MGLDDALAVARGWLDDVPGVHVVEAVDGDDAHLSIVVDGDIDDYLRVLPSTLFGVPVRFSHRRLSGG
jgi:hypothetical protein